MSFRPWRVVAAASLVLLALTVAPASPASAHTEVIVARAAFAAFEADNGVYTIDVGGRRDYTNHVVSAQTRGEFSVDGQQLYYLAVGFGPSVHFAVNGSLRRAWLQATIPVIACFNGEGTEVSDSRCPTGTLVSVDATFTGTGDVVRLSQPGNVLRGRLGNGVATQNGESRGPSIYGEIVENHTTVES